jgi:hypothetical protein
MAVKMQMLWKMVNTAKRVHNYPKFFSAIFSNTYRIFNQNMILNSATYFITFKKSKYYYCFDRIILFPLKSSFITEKIEVSKRSFYLTSNS